VAKAKKKSKGKGKSRGTYLSPGVYVEEVSSGARPIEGVGTAVAAFVGFARRHPVGILSALAAIGVLVAVLRSRGPGSVR
jgi:hypothetical protein